MDATRHGRICILTGDVVGSTTLDDAARGRLHGVMRDAAGVIGLELAGLAPLDLGIFRGDGWQLLILDPARALWAALYFRAHLRAEVEPESRDPVDTRIAIGVGKAESIPARVIEGDGEAFRLSGRALEAMGGRRLVYAAPEGSALNDWDVACRLLDELAMGWTARQARAVRGALLDRTQKDIGTLWSPAISQPAVAGHLAAAHWDAIAFTLEAYRRRCTKRQATTPESEGRP